MISFIKRLAIIIAIAVSVSVILILIRKLGVTWSSFLIIIFAVFVPATLGVVTNYLHWHLRYRILIAMIAVGIFYVFFITFLDMIP